MKTLENKVALITGGNSGIGLATAKLFVAEGAKVIITGRNQKSIDEALSTLGSNAVGIVTDITNMQHLQQLGAKITKHHTSIDIIFANAGNSLGIPISDISEDQYDSLFDTNVKGTYFAIKYLLPIINDNASIILNSSATIHRAFAGYSAYAGAKAAVATLAKTLSAELLSRKIRVNVVSPGPVETPLYDKMGFSLEQAVAAYADTVPMRRFAKPEEIASVVKFLASSESSFIIGEEIIAGGGVGTL